MNVVISNVCKTARESDIKHLLSSYGEIDHVSIFNQGNPDFQTVVAHMHLSRVDMNVVASRIHGHEWMGNKLQAYIPLFNNF